MSFVALANADFPIRRLSVNEYESLARSGILDEDDQLELLEGWIVQKMTKNPLHDGTVDEITRHLSALLPNGWYVRTQNVLTTPDSAPEPDLVVVRGVPRDYLRRHPTAADVALVVEVADSSVERDRLKCRIYAHAGVSTYWLVNLVDNQIEVYSDLAETGRNAVYTSELVYESDKTILFCVPNREAIEILVSDLLP